MDRRKSRQKVHWIVLLVAGVLAVANAASLCFGLFMLFIICARLLQRGSTGMGGLVVAMLFPFAAVVMVVSLVATIQFATGATEISWGFRAKLLISLLTGIVAEVAALCLGFAF